MSASTLTPIDAVSGTAVRFTSALLERGFTRDQADLILKAALPMLNEVLALNEESQRLQRSLRLARQVLET